MEVWLHTWLIILVSLCLLTLSACGDECEPGEFQCRNNIAQNCILGDEQSPHWIEDDCDESGIVCVAPDEVGSAMCSVLDGPMPGCPDDGFEIVCLGISMVTCQSGYATYTKECMVCEVGPFTQKCTGRIGDYCMHKGECLPGLECMDVPDQIDDICTLPCDCPNGPCNTCTEAEHFAKAGTPSCKDGMCQ